MAGEIKSSEIIYVFGSNLQGFHGAGGAGLAMRGDRSNNWRQDARFLKAMKAPVGHDDRKGEKAVYGVAEGLQQGRRGKGWAIPTVTKPGARRSISLSAIKTSLEKLRTFAIEHPEYEFECDRLGCGYAGYEALEILKLIEEMEKDQPLPENLESLKSVYCAA